MSEYSYQENVKRGVTGRGTGTCMPASFDRISNRFGVHPRSYELYDQLRRDYVEATGDNPVFVPDDIIKQGRQVKRRIYRELGVYTSKNFLYERVDSKAELQSTLGRLSIGGFRIGIHLDTDGLHMVGVEALDKEYYEVKSTWSPFENESEVHVDEIHEYLDHCPRLRNRPTSKKTFKEPNILALPPEPRR